MTTSRGHLTQGRACTRQAGPSTEARRWKPLPEHYGRNLTRARRRNPQREPCRKRSQETLQNSAPPLDPRKAHSTTVETSRSLGPSESLLLGRCRSARPPRDIHHHDKTDTHAGALAGLFSRGDLASASPHHHASTTLHLAAGGNLGPRRELFPGETLRWTCRLCTTPRLSRRVLGDLSRYHFQWDSQYSR